jgi:hypothetical protein
MAIARSVPNDCHLLPSRFELNNIADLECLHVDAALC